jgi:hypothetical protein
MAGCSTKTNVASPPEKPAVIQKSTGDAVSLTLNGKQLSDSDCSVKAGTGIRVDGSFRWTILKEIQGDKPDAAKEPTTATSVEIGVMLLQKANTREGQSVAGFSLLNKQSEGNTESIKFNGTLGAPKTPGTYEFQLTVFKSPEPYVPGVTQRQKLGPAIPIFTAPLRVVSE